MYEIENFQTDVLDRSHQLPVVVDFWAEWCGPCRILGPVLESLAGQGDGRWALAKVDTDKNQDIAAEYGIRGIPNVKLFVDGKVVNEFTGALPEAMVKKWLHSSLPNPAKAAIEDARRLMASNNGDGSAQILSGILDQDPANEEARVLMARVQMSRDRSQVAALLEGIEEDSEHFAEVSAIRTFVGMKEKAEDPSRLPEGPEKPLYVEGLKFVATGDFDAAIGRFIEVIRNDRSYDDDGGRRACVALFTILGEDHPVTLRRRRAFAGALNV